MLRVLIAFVFLQWVMRYDVASSASVSQATDHFDLTWKMQQQITSRAIGYSNLLKDTTLIDIRESTDLMSAIAQESGVRSGSSPLMKPLSWVLAKKEVVNSDVDRLRAELDDYKTNIALYESGTEDGLISYATWFSLTMQTNEGIDAVKAYANDMQARLETKTSALSRVSSFYNTKLDTIQPTIPDIINFVLQDPGDELAQLLSDKSDKTREKIETYIKDTFFPELEPEEHSEATANSLATTDSTVSSAASNES